VVGYTLVSKAGNRNWACVGLRVAVDANAVMGHEYVLVINNRCGWSDTNVSTNSPKPSFVIRQYNQARPVQFFAA
jgi:hypothetical protein